MAVSLKKGQGVSLRKEEYELSQVTIGLGWDCVEPSQRAYELINNVQVPIEWDLDVVAFLCDANGKVKNLGDLENGKPTLVNGDIVFFNSLKHASGQIWLTGDNLDGSGDGDDEQIIVNLNNMPEKFTKIAFIVQIYRGKPKNQSFGEVQNAFIRAVDGRNQEMARYDLSGGAQFADYRSMIFAELVREGSEWKFNAIGEPYETDTFVHILRDFYL